MADVARLIEEHDRAWNDHDVEALDAVYTDDVVFQNHTAGEAAVAGRASVLAHIAGIFGRWPDLRFSSRRLYLGDAVCVSEWTAHATGPDGRKLEWDGVDVMPIRDGRIARKDVYSTAHIARGAT
ncbi:MAG TPA: nuclear transport factor 2 family protein [Gaiellaceae bacterium]